MNKENQNLTFEIDLFIQKHIKDVKSVDQINMSDFHVSKPNEFVDLSEAYRDLQILKKILQISINLFNTFHLYADCDIKIKPEDDGPLTSYYRLDQHSSTWKCSEQPTLTDLSIALYNYILCFISIVKKESVKETITKCVMCDGDILEEEEQCSICDTYVHDKDPENMYYGKYKNNSEVDNKKENKSEKLGPSSFNVKYQNEKCGSDFLNLQKNFCRWKCGVCEYLNEYTFINCGTCGGMYEDGKWLCGECTKENSCGSDHCYKCGNVYVNVKDNSVKMYEQSRTLNKVKCVKCGSMKEGRDNDCKMCTKKFEGDEVKITKDQWKCCKCGLLQSFDFINCGACSESREVNGLWKCDGCTMINKCANVRCGACDKEKFSLNMKYSQNCANKVSINKFNDGEFRKSDYRGKENILYNGTSTSFRNDSKRDKYIYKTKNEDEVKIRRDQWQCGYCGLLQSFDMFVCNICKINREVAGMWHCDKCGVVNECTNSNCKMCYESNDYLKIKYIVEKKNILIKLKNLFMEDDSEEEDRSGEWKCKYILCRKWSKVYSIYCEHCGLFRDHSYIHGDVVKKLNENGVENVWICFGCNNLYELKYLKCSRLSCRKQRNTKTEII